MGPNVPADAASKRLIRPLCLVAKDRIHRIAQMAQYPKLKSCPYEQKLQQDGDRFFLEQLLRQLEPRFRDVKSAMLHCMSDVRLAHLLDTRYLDYLQPDPDAGKL
jgi:tRNA(Ile)-lysidine synthase TilS/MesJ